MTICIFTGPTLTAAKGREQIDACFLPPAQQGDVYRTVVRERPTAIGIIDGYFERVPAVCHKEILWAMAEGVHVLGAASMGALRASELMMFGMEGVGAIYQAYARGDLEADDEVAVAHATAADGYRPLSDALVNVRATLRAAEVDQVISPETRQQIERIAQGLFYPDRCYPIIFQRAAAEGISESEIAKIKLWLPHGRVDQKRIDALELLATMRACCLGEVPPRKVRYHFEWTEAWEHIRRNAEQGTFKSAEAEVGGVR